jgi:hypothetical protein
VRRRELLPRLLEPLIEGGRIGEMKPFEKGPRILGDRVLKTPREPVSLDADDIAVHAVRIQRERVA